MKLFDIFKKRKSDCKHDLYLNRWHWTHGASGMETRQIEAEYICCLCKKKFYAHPERGSDFEKMIMACSGAKVQ